MSNDNQAYEKSEAERNWIISITNMLPMVEKSSKMSIYKVPKKLSKLKEDAYTPSIVSIGPFHHNNKAMQAFEEHKERYMLYLFTRIPLDAKSTVQDCATAILKLEKTARRRYSEEIGFSKFEFAEMLLVDGCFLLELFLKYSNIENETEDPLINNAQTIATLQHDLALLENQIPFSVLETLFNVIKGHVPQSSQSLRSPFTEHDVATLALLFFKSVLGFSWSNQEIERKASNLPGRYDHLLDILHKFYSPAIARNPETSDLLERPISDLKRRVLRDCATKLMRAGIAFAGTITDPNRSLLDIEFLDTVGIVTMPILCIREAITETIFRNLIAFEQCGGTGSTSHRIASYVFLMRSLLHSSHDVKILHAKGIIFGEDVTSLFESLCNGVVLNDFYFSNLCKDVNRFYCERMSEWRWGRLYLILDDSWRTLYLNLDNCWRTTKHKWHGYMLDLFNVYLKNPWTTLKVIAAVLLLIFTALQTYYTILSYYK